MKLADALRNRRSCRDFTAAPVSLESVERMANAGFGETTKDGKRAAPSAHAVYPLQLVLTVGSVTGLEAGVYEAGPDLSIGKTLKQGNVMEELAKAALEDQQWIASSAFVLTLVADGRFSTQHFAEQEPLMRRGDRYLYLEAGAVAQSMMLQAAEENIGSTLVAGFNDAKTLDCLGLSLPTMPVLHLCCGMPA